MLILIKYVSTGDRTNDNIINNNIVIIKYFSTLINFMFFNVYYRYINLKDKLSKNITKKLKRKKDFERSLFNC